jgi:zinc protease
MLSCLGEILSIKLIEVLREEASGVYGISASGYISKIPSQRYNLNITFPCGPDNVEKLTKMALSELDKIILNGPEQKDIDKIKEARSKNLKEKLKQNNYWINLISSSLISGFKPEDPNKGFKGIEKINKKQIKNIAKKYCSGSYYRFVLKPEK